MQADIALSGVIGALSYALDITEGQPAGHAVRSCATGMRLAEELRLPSKLRSDLFYSALAARETHLARVADPLAAGVLTLSTAPEAVVPARVSGARARDR